MLSANLLHPTPLEKSETSAGLVVSAGVAVRAQY